MEKSANGWRTCSRGHKSQSATKCPTCWPGGVVRKKKVPKKRQSA